MRMSFGQITIERRRILYVLTLISIRSKINVTEDFSSHCLDSALWTQGLMTIVRPSERPEARLALSSNSKQLAPFFFKIALLDAQRVLNGIDIQWI